MQELLERIKKEAFIKDEKVVKVDTFLNHQIDPKLMDACGEELYQRFKHKTFTKVVTIESSGIAPAVACAMRFGIPCVFIKKTKPSTMQTPLTAEVYSFTKNIRYNMYVDASLFSDDEHILFIDDFLANGEAFLGFEKVMKEINAHIDGVGIVIEKSFQAGRKLIEDRGYDIYSIARISSLENNVPTFIEE